MLRHIDSAANREKALVAKLDTDPEFVAFMNEVMVEIDYAARKDDHYGAIEFKGLNTKQNAS